MHTPLADQIRPSTLDDVVGQRQLLAAGKPLRRIIESGKIPNMIFYGPSGVGKTTVARIIADSTSMTLHKLNGTSASTADIRDVVAEVGTSSWRPKECCSIWTRSSISTRNSSSCFWNTWKTGRSP